MASSVDVTLTADEWEEFKKKFNKSYKDDEEETNRKNLYLQTKKNILEHNKKYETGEVTYKMGINHFADLTPEERSKYSGARKN